MGHELLRTFVADPESDLFSRRAPYSKHFVLPGGRIIALGEETESRCIHKVINGQQVTVIAENARLLSSDGETFGAVLSGCNVFINGELEQEQDGTTLWAESLSDLLSPDEAGQIALEESGLTLGTPVRKGDTRGVIVGIEEEAPESGLKVIVRTPGGIKTFSTVADPGEVPSILGLHFCPPVAK